jgi:GTP-binding protein Era
MSDEHKPNQPEEAETNAEFEAMLAAALGTTAHDKIARAVEETEPEEDTPAGHKSGFVAVIGQPNVGKSTLINRILGEKIAIVSPKPQTTRLRQLGILTRDREQIIFVDTPGIHQPQDELGTFMVEVARAALADADVILFMVDVSRPPNRQDKQIVAYLNDLKMPDKIIIVMNKMDIAPNPAAFKQHFESYCALLPRSAFVTIVATEGHNVPELVEKIIELLPEGPRYYPKDQVSDIAIRDVVGEMIREQVLLRTHQEVPHSIAVEIDEFKRRSDKLLFIAATIYTEREGQKGIIIGKGGEMLKTIATAARREIEEFVGSKVYLEIHVKVLPNWRQDENALQRFGYRL